eukprot:m.75702 g.75702  ORF g.75702 m.75702 type:complete len:346 (+) comp20534_c0_seq2:100-1137(+)
MIPVVEHIMVTVRVGSRKSQLAMIQTTSVVTALKEAHPDHTFEIINMETIGDKILDKALSKVGEKSLFTKELEVLLVDQDPNRRVDFVVHSLKDLPTTLPEGLCLGAIGKREDARDAVIFHPSFDKGTKLSDLKPKSVVGTSSLRRAAQLRGKYPHLVFENVRGNLNTRLKKLEDSNPSGQEEGKRYSCLVLAAAGVERMGWQDKIGQLLDRDICLYAVGQASLGIECRSDDEQTKTLLQSFHHSASAKRCLAERAFMRALEGGCSVPLGVHTQLDEEKNILTMTGGVYSLDGKESIVDEITNNVTTEQEAETLGQELAIKLKAKGAVQLLESIPKPDLSAPKTL